MGSRFSSACCGYCNAHLPTEEEDFTGIRLEVRQRRIREKTPLPFRDYLNRKKTKRESELSLNFLDSRERDYLNTDNRSMNMSGILKDLEVPKIPSPSQDSLLDFQMKDKRSYSLSSRDSLLKGKLGMFIPKQRNSLQSHLINSN